MNTKVTTKSMSIMKAIHISQFQMNGTMLFVLISTVNLFISFITAEYVYSGNTLVPYSVILVSTFVGLEVLLYLFVVPLSELVDSIDRKRKGISAIKPFVAEIHVAEEANVETVTETPTAEEAFIATPVADASEDKPTDEELQAIYNRSDAQNRELDAKIKENKKELIMIYLYEILAPLLPKDEIDLLWIEFDAWIDHSAYHPIGRKWKWTKEITSLDVRHLVWNIAKRLGMDKGYGTETCAEFIKNMFPDTCEEVKKSTLSQTLTADPDKGCIKLDRPDKDNPFKFHNNG